MLVGRRANAHEDVRAAVILPVHARKAQMVGDKRRPAQAVRLTGGRRIKQTLAKKAVFICGIGVVFIFTQGKAVGHGDVFDPVCYRVQIAQKFIRFGSAQRDHDMIAALDEREGLFKGDDFGSVVHEPFLH